MKALAREEHGKVISLLGCFLEQVGSEQFFTYLAKVCDVCFIDTRVLFAHFKLQLTEEERFLSDLGQYEDIANPWVKEFTKASVDCEIPVVLGGHSLVTGGMWAIVDILKRERALSTVGRVVHKLTISSGSPLVGLKLSSLSRLGIHGVTVVAVDTPQGPVLDPAVDYVFCSHDVLHCVGSEAGMAILVKLLGT